MMNKTKIIIAGIGGVGGYFGGLLAKHYENDAQIEIHFIARGAHLNEIQSKGLTVIHGDLMFNAKPTSATDNPKDIGNADYVIVATKSYDLEAMIEQLKPCIGQDTIIIPLLNGVNSRERIQHILPDSLVIDGCAYIVSRMKAPGIIENSGNIQSIAFGLDQYNDERFNTLHQLCTDAKINAKLSNTITSTIWEKFIFLSPLATATSYFDVCIGEIVNDNEKLELTSCLIDEVLQLAKAKQILVSDDVIEKTLTRIKALPYEATSSMHFDFQSKKSKTELETLTGYVIEQGKLFNLSMPTYVQTYSELKRRNN